MFIVFLDHNLFTDGNNPTSVNYNAKYVQQTMINSNSVLWTQYACGGMPSSFNRRTRRFYLLPTLIGIAPRNSSSDVSYHSMLLFFNIAFIFS